MVIQHLRHSGDILFVIHENFVQKYRGSLKLICEFPGYIYES